MRFIILFLISLMLCTLSSVTLAGDFGQVTIERAGLGENVYPVSAAYLYKGVNIQYDTTAQVLGKDEIDLYFFPQISKGENYVLHLILANKDSISNDPGYDIYFNLGNSLQDNISLAGTSRNAYLFEGGRFPAGMHYSSNENGFFKLADGDVQSSVSGDFELSFDYPDSGDSEVRTTIKGNLQIPDTYVLSGKTAGLQAQKEKRQEDFKRNIVIAVLTALFIVVGVGL